ncbi:G-type lectin S-receptor-like serine/threonine-protein kinase [Dorcoceras hygrometricum]|uniref:G-type lectin S-receptor-like serine/threonine-protein kinase n=1 Tax=Dorcoceras hygrometricum TaxID=472368 RepID=A0A2Z7AZG3_9LAMI|nr:G-type lectin S-receptor-like serine/threonine-protein kinase [Dorcoceras hygrometricum]
MSSHTSPASRKLPKTAPNEASQQEESSANTLTSIGAVYRRQSEKIRRYGLMNNPTDNLRYKADFPLRSESHIRYDLTPKQIPTYSNDVTQDSDWIKIGSVEFLLLSRFHYYHFRRLGLSWKKIAKELQCIVVRRLENLVLLLSNLHDLISAIDSSILSVDCVEWLNILQQIVQQLFAQLLSILCHNTSRNSCFFVDWILCAWFPRFATSAFLASGYHVDWICNSTEARDWIHSGCPVVGREMLATGFIALKLACDCAPADLYRSSSNMRLFLASVPAGPFAPAELSSSAEHDVVTDYIIIDGPLRCSSCFSFDVPADPSSSSSACSWFLSYQLIHYAPAGRIELGGAGGSQFVFLFVASLSWLLFGQEGGIFELLGTFVVVIVAQKLKELLLRTSGNTVLLISLLGYLLTAMRRVEATMLVGEPWRIRIPSPGEAAEE